MKIKHYFNTAVMLSIIAVSFSCSKEANFDATIEQPTAQAQSQYQRKSPEVIVSTEDVSRIAMTIPMDGSTLLTKGQEFRNVKEIIPVSFSRNNTQSAFYIVNYERNQGFALISGTRNYHPVLAHSDTGNFPLDDNMPYGIKMWMNGIKSVIAEQMEQMCIDSLVGFRKEWELFERTSIISLAKNIETAPATKSLDPLDQLIQTKMAEWAKQGIGCYNLLGGYGNGVGVTASNEVLDELYRTAMNRVNGQYPFRVEPFVIEIQPTPHMATKNSLLKTLWHQDWPYNKITNDATGCVAVAMAQVMKFHGHPSSKFDFSQMLNWYDNDPCVHLPSNVTSNEVARLMKDIGNAVDMVYLTGIGSFPLAFLTGDPIGNALRNNYSYSSNITRADYNYSGVRNQLDLNRPVIMYGFEGTLSFWTGHTWVAAGYNEYESRSEYYLVYIEDTSFGPIVTEPSLAHIQQHLYFNRLYINWGWWTNPTMPANSQYNCNGFYDSNGFRPTGPSGTSYHYHSGLKMYLNVYPR